MRVLGLDHVQVAMPAGEEERARAFYSGVLGMEEIAKAPNLAARGGVWFSCGGHALHLGVEAEFRPARKAHPALLVDDLRAALDACERAGFPTRRDEPLDGYERAYVHDPFGNRIELMQRV
jgi:catechol 2,3-dioxygenase-like lactoylglutathione lyase family enzyme